MKKLIVLVALVFAISNVASAAVIITDVQRAGGDVDNREPYGPYDGDDPVLASDPGGLADGVLVFSDRTYPYASTPTELVGAEYIRTFNEDKNAASTVTYTVTLGIDCIYAIGIDDRWQDVAGINEQPGRIDSIADFAPAGTFTDSGLDVFIRERADGSRDRPLSVFTAPLAAGTYVFKGVGTNGNNFMVMGAVPEPATLALLGFGGLGLLRRKR